MEQNLTLQAAAEGAAAAAAAAATAATAIPPSFKLAHGYIQMADSSDFPPRPAAPAAAAPEEHPSKKANPGPAVSISKAFWFYNTRGASPILLYSNQALRLVDELPKAFSALARDDRLYCYKIAESKTQLLTLEVNFWNDKTSLQLKKYFRTKQPLLSQTLSAAAAAAGAYQEVDENAWIPTKSSLQWDPELDQPAQILHFLLSCCRR